MKEDSTRVNELVDKWNEDTITLEEVKELFKALTKSTYGGKSHLENPILLKRIKQTIDEKRRVYVEGRMMVSPLYIDDNGDLAADDYEKNQKFLTVSFKGPAFSTDFHRMEYETPAAIIDTAYGEEILFSTIDIDIFTIDTRNWIKEGLISNTIEKVRHGKTDEIFEYNPLEPGKIIEGHLSPGYEARMVQLIEPDRVLKTRYTVKKRRNSYNHETSGKTTWETNLDLRGNIGEVSARDLPGLDEAEQVRMLAAAGEFNIENEGLLTERFINPQYYSQETLEEMLSKIEDETLREQYRKIFEKRISEQQAENNSAKTL